MKRIFLSLLPLSIVFFLALPGQTQTNHSAWILDIKGAIGPAAVDYFERSLKKARAQNIDLLILRLDTPGGLDLAMRDIVQAIIASPIPVATYVAPSGSRAASAGTYILYASHIAAMAPGTNLGAATPVKIGGIDLEPTQKKDANQKEEGKTVEQPQPAGDTMARKMINDAEAYLRSLAQLHGRNPDWASEAVRASASLSAKEALEKKVVDIIAVDVADLLAQIHHREVKILGERRQLTTTGMHIETLEPDWRNRLLSIITDPNVAYILMLLGIYGLFFELSNPGSLLPGVIGAVSLLLALFAFQILPVNYTGVALILLGIAFMIGEALIPSFGALGIGGIIAFAVGSIILMDTETPGYAVSRSLIGGMVFITTLFFIWVIRTWMKMRIQPVVSGQEGILGEEGYCLYYNERGQLYIQVHGETWRAESQTQMLPGQRVKVIKIQGLTLVVETVGELTPVSL